MALHKEGKARIGAQDLTDYPAAAKLAHVL
jgi:hypothetical protein